MKTIIEHQIKKLEIDKPDFSKKYYQLVHQNECFGSLMEMEDKETLSELVTSKGVYSVKRSGFFNPYITLRKGKFEQNEAKCYLNLRGESTIYLEGATFHFKMNNVWKNQWCWLNEKNQILITLKPIISGTMKGDVEISKEAYHYTQLELLTLLGVYFLIKYQNETEN